MSEAEGAQGRARRALTGTPDPDPRGPSTMRPGGEGGEPVPGRERGRATSETWEGPPARGWPLPAGDRPAAGRAPGRRHDAHSPRGPGAAFPEEDNRGFSPRFCPTWDYPPASPRAAIGAPDASDPPRRTANRVRGLPPLGTRPQGRPCVPQCVAHACAPAARLSRHACFLKISVITGETLITEYSGFSHRRNLSSNLLLNVAFLNCMKNICLALCWTLIQKKLFYVKLKVIIFPSFYR